MSCERELGASRLRTIFWLLVLVGIIWVAVKVTPAYVNNYQLEDAMKTEARFAVVQRKGEEDIRDAIFRKIKDLEIPAKREDIHVESNPGGVRINLSYTVVVDLPGYQLRLHFNPTADNRAL